MIDKQYRLRICEACQAGEHDVYEHSAGPYEVGKKVQPCACSRCKQLHRTRVVKELLKRFGNRKG